MLESGTGEGECPGPGEGEPPSKDGLTLERYGESVRYWYEYVSRLGLGLECGLLLLLTIGLAISTHRVVDNERTCAAAAANHGRIRVRGRTLRAHIPVSADVDTDSNPQTAHLGVGCLPRRVVKACAAYADSYRWDWDWGILLRHCTHHWDGDWLRRKNHSGGSRTPNEEVSEIQREVADDRHEAC